MRIQPRQQLLDIWRATARASYDAEAAKWRWGGREPANSIADAEQLLCIMLPATENPQFKLDQPDQASDEVLDALRPLGGPMDVPRLLTSVIVEYLERYSRPDGTPDFSGGSYFVPLDPAEVPTAEQRDLDLVEGFASSITLTLAALGFVKVFRASVERADVRADLEKLERLASLRLTAALIGLVRSFAILSYEADHPYGVALLRMVNQGRRNDRRVTQELQRALRDVAAGLRDLNVGIEQVEGLERPGRLFECGWSWGVTKGAPQVPVSRARSDPATEAEVVQREGTAQDAPYLYFTIVALEAISELFSERTRRLGLLDDEQQRLSTTLRLRFDLTQAYYATIARFGAGNRWPVEDIPWQTADDAESDYFTLLVTSIVVRDLAVRRDTDADLRRLGQVLVELANRARITRRPIAADPAIDLHDPGVTIELEGTDALGPRLAWVASDYAPLLLKRTIYVASQINSIGMRGELLELADDIWDHVASRRLGSGIAGGLWDQPAGAFPKLGRAYDQPSWHHTVRVVESLVLAANMAATHPLRSDRLAELTDELLAEADHLLDQQLLSGAGQSGPSLRNRIESVRNRIRRSRAIKEDRPGTAVALLLSVLQDLDDLNAALPGPTGEP